MDQLSKPRHVHETRSHVWKDAVLPLGEPCPKDPYIHMYRFRENVYSFFERSFDGHGDPWMHLIVGPEKALLIDNGFGIGDLRGTVEDIIGDMPLYVTNTHASIDHAWGNFQFDTVHAFEYQVPYLRRFTADQWDKLIDPATGRGKWQDFDRADIVPFRDYEIVPCPNNYRFDLGGGYEVEMIHLPGHQAGHCAFLDHTNRILFGGDSLLFVCAIDQGHNEGMPYDEYATVEGIRDELAKLVKRMDEFDCVFMSHMVMGEDKKIVADLYQACCDVCNDPECNQFTNVRKDGSYTLVREVGSMAVEYTPGRVYKSQITHGKPTFVHEWQSLVWGEAIVPLAKHYDMCPYAQVYQFRPNIWSIRIRTVWVSVVKGPEKVLVVDTGYGVGDLRGLIRELVGDMPLVVVNTHVHGDHTLGNVQFDRVYIHEHGVPAMKKFMAEKDERKWRYYNERAKALQKYMKNNGAFEEKDMQPYRDYELIGVPDHYTWNLGGDHEIELIYMPGHCFSGAVYLDKKNRIVFGGDSLLFVAGMGRRQKGNDYDAMPYVEYGCVEGFYNGLCELYPRMDEFDCVFMGHMIQGVDKQIVADFYEAAKAIMEDPESNNYVSGAQRDGYRNRVMARGAIAIEYAPERVWIDPSKHSK